MDDVERAGFVTDDSSWAVYWMVDKGAYFHEVSLSGFDMGVEKNRPGGSSRMILAISMNVFPPSFNLARDIPAPYHPVLSISPTQSIAFFGALALFRDFGESAHQYPSTNSHSHSARSARTPRQQYSSFALRRKTLPCLYSPLSRALAQVSRFFFQSVGEVIGFPFEFWLQGFGLEVLGRFLGEKSSYSTFRGL